VDFAQLAEAAKKRSLNQALSLGAFENLPKAVDESLTLANRFFENSCDAYGMIQIIQARVCLKASNHAEELTFLFKEIGDRLDIPGRSPELAADFWALHRRCKSMPEALMALGFNAKAQPPSTFNSSPTKTQTQSP
jgi:hypothetical protein